jgi:hypothetical protein
MMDHLFPAVSIRETINKFVEDCLLDHSRNDNDHSDNDALTSGFVVIARFPKFNLETIEKHAELLNIGLVNILKPCQ